MTRDEAVSIIKERIHVTEYVGSSYVDCVDIEALRIAIKALEQQESQWIPMTKEEVLQTGYEGREVRFHIGGRLFAIRELAQ